MIFLGEPGVGRSLVLGMHNGISEVRNGVIGVEDVLRYEHAARTCDGHFVSSYSRIKGRHRVLEAKEPAGSGIASSLSQAQHGKSNPSLLL